MIRLTKAQRAQLVITDHDRMRIKDAARDLEHVVYALQAIQLDAQEANNTVLETVMDRLSGDAMLVMEMLQTLVEQYKEG